MGRKPKKPTKQDLLEIESLAGLGLTQAQIAKIKGISIDILRKYSNNSYQQGKAKAIAKVAKTAFEMAVSGKNTAMTIFFLKTQARWTEHPAIPDVVLRALNIQEENDDDTED